MKKLFKKFGKVVLSAASIFGIGAATFASSDAFAATSGTWIAQGYSVVVNTDANSYSAGATSVDVQAIKNYGPTTIYYAMYIQVYINGGWLFKSSHTGYFNSATPWISFPIDDFVPKNSPGNYETRIALLVYSDPGMSQYIGTCYTNSFPVYN